MNTTMHPRTKIILAIIVLALLAAGAYAAFRSSSTTDETQKTAADSMALTLPTNGKKTVLSRSICHTDARTCLGQLENPQPVGNVTVYDLISTTNLLRFGLVEKKTDGTEQAYEVDFDFTPEEYGEAEYSYLRASVLTDVHTFLPQR